MMEKEQKIISIPLNGINLIVQSIKSTSDYKGVIIYLEIKTKDNIEYIDIAHIECSKSDNYNIIETYLYENIFSEDWTQKFDLNIEKIKERFAEEHNYNVTTKIDID